MRCRRLIAIACVTAAFAATAGCTDSTSPTARAWERSTTQANLRGENARNVMVASDGLGGMVFAPEDGGSNMTGRSTFAHVPGE